MALASEGAILVPLFIRLMIPNGAMILGSKDCHNEVIITSLQGVLKRPLNDNTCSTTVYGFMVPDNICNKAASLCNQY